MTRDSTRLTLARRAPLTDTDGSSGEFIGMLTGGWQYHRADRAWWPDADRPGDGVGHGMRRHGVRPQRSRITRREHRAAGPQAPFLAQGCRPCPAAPSLNSASTPCRGSAPELPTRPTRPGTSAAVACSGSGRLGSWVSSCCRAGWVTAVVRAGNTIRRAQGWTASTGFAAGRAQNVVPKSERGTVASTCCW